jgi:hypothetical protein
MRSSAGLVPGRALLHTYIVTTRYSKEERGSLEIGDAIYPYDPDVEVLVPDVKGVVVVKTKLEPRSLRTILRAQVFSAVEYVSYVATCSNVVELGEEAVQSLANAIRGYVEAESLCVGKVRVPRTGTLGRGFVSSLLRRLRSLLVDNCKEVLSLEVFGELVCFGHVIYSTKVVG